MSVAMAEEVENVANGLLFFYLLIDELVYEIDACAVVFGISHIGQLVDFLRDPHLVLQRALEDVLRVLEIYNFILKVVSLIIKKSP